MLKNLMIGAGALVALGAATMPSFAADPVQLTLRYCWGGDAEVAAMEKVIGMTRDRVAVTRNERIEIIENVFVDTTHG